MPIAFIENGGLAPKKDLTVLTLVPSESLDVVMRKGLASQKAIAKDPDMTRTFLESRSIDDEASWREGLKKKLKDEFYVLSLTGPSVFFTELDVDKVSDPRHFKNQFDTTTLEINLGQLLEDMPETQVYGVELHPYDPDGPEFQGRRRNLTADEIWEYTQTDPKELWKHYKDEYLGRYYAADVPHAFVITPSGIIPPQYLSHTPSRDNPYKVLDGRGTLRLSRGDKNKLAMALAETERNLWAEVDYTDWELTGYEGYREALDEPFLVGVVYEEGASPLEGPFEGYFIGWEIDSDMEGTLVPYTGLFHHDPKLKAAIAQISGLPIVYWNEGARSRKAWVAQEYRQMFSEVLRRLSGTALVGEARPTTSYKRLKQLETLGILEILYEKLYPHLLGHGEHAYIMIGRTI